MERGCSSCKLQYTFRLHLHRRLLITNGSAVYGIKDTLEEGGSDTPPTRSHSVHRWDQLLHERESRREGEGLVETRELLIPTQTNAGWLRGRRTSALISERYAGQPRLQIGMEISMGALRSRVQRLCVRTWCSELVVAPPSFPFRLDTGSRLSLRKAHKASPAVASARSSRVWESSPRSGVVVGGGRRRQAGASCGWRGGSSRAMASTRGIRDSSTF
ncbi:hypothetical protein C8Q73DRAFT_469798 [Cubamyces lactineus]|nr:hypothetical protein C8Q73DRAFT_469798 [Cubamyces lactineus]